MDDLLSEFLTETAESLDVIDNELVRFEADPGDRATLNNIFRLVHTIKGTCGFLGLPRLEALAHAGETLLGRYRDGTLFPTEQTVSLVLDSIDRIKSILSHLEGAGAEPNGHDRDLIDLLEAAAEGKLKSNSPPAPSAAPVAVPANPAKKPAPANLGPGERWDEDLGRVLRPGEVSLAELEAAFNAVDAEEIKAEPAAAPAPVVSAAPTAPPAIVEPPRVEPTRPIMLEDDADDGARAKGEGPQTNATLRVPVDVLEDMMTLVSELVLTRNQLLQMVRSSNDSQFKAPLQRLSAITGELQDDVMKTRMQPIGNAWKKIPRIVRDAARDLGKKIDLVMEGEATELDRQVLELIKDPLTHMIRNSCDHGLERPDVRVGAGKPETGTIRLVAYHEGGHIIVQLSDDGAGLNTKRIREKGLEKGLIAAADADTMSDAEIHRLIFAPGFSTAAQVTNMSGRGVGMDVVKTNIDAIGGVIELDSRAGQGTVFTIKIPLTLAIVSALILGASGMRFALPQLAVVELVRVSGQGANKIEHIHNTRVLRLRDKLLPLVDLSVMLGLTSAARPGRAQFVVVMQVGANRFGMVVDEVFDTEEIVVKPVASVLRGLSMYQGATILGDGSVIMIVDPNGVSRTMSSATMAAMRANVAETVQQQTASDAISLLVFKAGGEEPRAVPLSLVTRLEELDVATLEPTRRGRVVQYRGQLMPVIHPAGEYAFRSEGRQPILVFTYDGRTIGLAVDAIVDIIHEPLKVQLADATPGVMGTAVLRGKATEVIELGYHLEMATDSWSFGAAAAQRSVLLVEANPFFRNMMTPLLQAAGYRVTGVDNAKAASAQMEAGGQFDVVLADIDDAAMRAELAETLRNSPAGDSIARLGLTKTDARDPAFGDAVRKTDRAGLLAALDYLVKTQEKAA